MKRLAFACSLVVLVSAAPAAAQVDFSRYVAVGDSLTAGFASGGLMLFYQERSYPNMLAEQALTPAFALPLVSRPGIPPLLELVHLAPDLEIAAPMVAPGVPINAEFAEPYSNLGVPGATVFDALNTTGNIFNLLAGNQDNVMHDLILRFPEVDPGTGPIPATAVVQALAQQPTFLTVWLGNNDILGAAVYATPVDNVTMTPLAVFEQLYATALGTLATSGAPMVVMTIPDVTVIPFVTTLDPYVDVPGVGRVSFVGSNGPISEDSYLTLGASGLLAQGYGLPIALGGNGEPLPDDLFQIGDEVVPGVVLRPDEVAVISERVAAMNDIIRATAAQVGAEVLDINAIFARIAAGDRWILGGIELSADFLTGGIFSYDGVHPQNIGYALVAVELIDLINARFGTDVPQLNMNQVLCADGCAGNGPPTVIPAGAKITFTSDAFASLRHSFPLLGDPRSRPSASRRYQSAD